MLKYSDKTPSCDIVGQEQVRLKNDPHVSQRRLPKGLTIIAGESAALRPERTTLAAPYILFVSVAVADTTAVF